MKKRTWNDYTRLTRLLAGCTVWLLPNVELVAGWGVTEVTNVEAEWGEAPWTRGVPGARDTAYVQGTAKIVLGQDTVAEVYGVRVGDGVPQLTTLQVGSAVLETEFIVLGDAADSNANFVQMGGRIRVKNTEALDFEIGNPANAATEKSHSMVTFAAGEAALGDLRFNLRKERKSRLSFFGILHRVTADSLVFESGTESDWTPGEVNFVLSDAGIVPLKVSGEVDFGSGDKAVIMVDGSKYAGDAKEFVLIEAGSMTGKPKDVELTGLPRSAEVVQEGDRLLLRR